MKFFKRFYNPFKPHIASLNNGRYVIRQFGMCGWECMDTDKEGGWVGKYWSSKSGIFKYCQFNSQHQATEHLALLQKPSIKFTGRVQ